MIRKTVKRSTTGAHRIFTERTKITCSRLIRDQLLKTAKDHAIGSEKTAVNQGDLYTINSILNRVAIYTN